MEGIGEFVRNMSPEAFIAANILLVGGLVFFMRRLVTATRRMQFHAEIGEAIKARGCHLLYDYPLLGHKPPTHVYVIETTPAILKLLEPGLRQRFGIHTEIRDSAKEGEIELLVSKVAVEAGQGELF